MATRIFLHVGAQKTGTSFVQMTLWTNRAALEQHDVRLPLRDRPFDFDAVSDLRGGVWADRELRATWDDLTTAVHGTEGTVVVSEELFCTCTPAQIDRVASSLAPAELHVVHTARDVGRQLPAEWQQTVRARSDQEYATYISDLRADPDHPFWAVQDPLRVHAAWKGAVAPDRYHLLTVPPSGRPPLELWDRFAAVIGAGDVEVTLPRGADNPSMGVGQTELLRRLNAKLGDRFPMRTPYIDNVRQHLMLPALLGAPGQRIGVPPEHAEWIVDRAAQMVSEVHGLADVVDLVGDPQDLRADITRAVTSPEALTDGELLDLALSSWIRQLEHTEKTVEKQKANRARRQAKAQEQRDREAAEAGRFTRRLRRRARSALGR